jgi:hypothetical protein
MWPVRATCPVTIVSRSGWRGTNSRERLIRLEDSLRVPVLAHAKVDTLSAL